MARFGEIYSCSSLSGSRQDVFTVTTTVDGDVLYGTVTETANNDETDSVGAMLYDAEGNYICYYGSYPGSCELGAAGTYTVVVALSYGQGDMAYTLSVQSQRSPSSCRTLGNAFFSFASPGRGAELATGSAGACYTFDQPVGTVLQTYPAATTGGRSVQGQILDADYQPVCPIQSLQVCALTTPGPYHLMVYEFYGQATSYTLRMARISKATGCPVLRTAAFGDPGDSVGVGTLDGQNPVVCHKLRAQPGGGVAVRIHEDQSVWWDVYDDAGRKVCDKYDGLRSCTLPAAGDHTILTGSRHWDPISYQIAVTALHRSAGCATGTSLRWDQPAAVLTQTSPVQTNCQQFQGRAGQRVVAYAAPTEHNGVSTTLVDGAGRALCLDHSEETGCLLPADGTYRLISYVDMWGSDSATYRVQVRSLSTPKGCPVVLPGGFNEPPAGAYAPIRCRIVRIPGPGVHQIRAFDGENNRTYASVFDSTGHRICDDSGRCEFPAAGDYTVVLAARSTGSVIDNDYSYVLSVLPAQPAGCPPLSQELYRATFTDPGQFLCVQLPQTTGQSIVEWVPTGVRSPSTVIFDSAGEYLCDSSSLWQYSCTLDGAAPYFAVLSKQAGEMPGPFAARFQRVDGPASCPAFDGAALVTGGDDFSICRTIPADAHTARGTFTWNRTAGTGGAHLSVFDANGIRRCGPTGTFPQRTVTCTLPAGPLTLVLNTAEAGATYDLTHQPITTS
ncbi:hypothetical protein [Actinoplanes xinjiangensis]|uniref:hypothetical protein n=1 Tax=Actinoplanes xinjiangensis TaxID=512350 RepID=UPI0034264CC2